MWKVIASEFIMNFMNPVSESNELLRKTLNETFNINTISSIKIGNYPQFNSVFMTKRPTYSQNMLEAITQRIS